MVEINGIAVTDGKKMWYLKEQRFGKAVKFIRIRIKDAETIAEIKNSGLYNGKRIQHIA